MIITRCYWEIELKLKNKDFDGEMEKIYELKKRNTEIKSYNNYPYS